MTVALPTNAIADATPRYIDMGSIMSASLGGEDQRLNRMGSRWGADFKTKPMKGEEARVWIARLVRGMREKASIKFPQPGVLLPTGDAPVTAAAMIANAELMVGFKVLWASNHIKEGVFFHVVVGGKNYVYQFAAAPTPNPSNPGNEFVAQIQPPLRTPLPLGASLVFPAIIEGYVRGNPKEWSIDVAKVYGLQFSIDEAA